jgi:hypothetical protein
VILTESFSYSESECSCIKWEKLFEEKENKHVQVCDIEYICFPIRKPAMNVHIVVPNSYKFLHLMLTILGQFTLSFLIYLIIFYYKLSFKLPTTRKVGKVRMGIDHR